LDLALNTDTVGEDPLFKEDIKVTMADTGLYDFLLKVVTVSGVVKPEETGSMEEEPKKEKDEKKSMQGVLIISHGGQDPDPV
jgi:gamma-tubulin complex component 2